eukprot:6195813-Pleurochrysis_carterae.AAC.2
MSIMSDDKLTFKQKYLKLAFICDPDAGDERRPHHQSSAHALTAAAHGSGGAGDSRAIACLQASYGRGRALALDERGSSART